MVATAQTVRTQLSSRSFVEPFSANVRRFPDAPALVWRGEPVSVSSCCPPPHFPNTHSRNSSFVPDVPV